MDKQFFKVEKYTYLPLLQWPTRTKILRGIWNDKLFQVAPIWDSWAEKNNPEWEKITYSFFHH